MVTAQEDGVYSASILTIRKAHLELTGEYKFDVINKRCKDYMIFKLLVNSKLFHRSYLT